MKSSRSATNLSQEDVANLMGISKSTLARIETLEVTPDFSNIVDFFDLMQQRGVKVNLLEASSPLIIEISKEAIDRYEKEFSLKRRVDRKRDTK